MLKLYNDIKDVPLEVKKDIRDTVYYSITNNIPYLPEVQKLCDIEQIDINSPAIQAIIKDQVQLTEYETKPWWKNKDLC